MHDAPRPEPEIEANFREALSNLNGCPLTAELRKEVERRLEARLLIVGQLVETGQHGLD